ncbi:MAG: prepilin-type cleavage/methylation domain-containing protein [Spirochaetota bacterium]
MKRSQIRKGLTLVEQVVVVMIVGMLISMTMSSLMNLINPSAEDDADKLKASFIYCYQTARIKNQTVILELDIEKNSYQAFRLNRGDEGIDKKKLLDVSMAIDIVHVTDMRGIKYEAGKLKIPFTYSGVSEDYNIHLGSGGEIKKTVQLYRYNGRVVLKNGEKDRISTLGTEQAEGTFSETDD